MTHKLKTETFSQKIEHSGGVMFLPLTPLFSFVTFHLKWGNCYKHKSAFICDWSFIEIASNRTEIKFWIS